MSTSTEYENSDDRIAHISAEALRMLVPYAERQILTDADVYDQSGQTPSEELAEEFDALDQARNALQEADVDVGIEQKMPHQRF